MIVLWNTLYMDAVLDQLRCEGYPVLPEDEARLAPFGHEHINMLGRYSFSVPPRKRDPTFNDRVALIP